MDPAVVAFLSSLVLLLAGGLVGSHFTSRRERSKELLDRRHRIYMLLLEIYQLHFWISSGDMPEIPGRTIEEEHKRRYYETALRISDELRGADELPQLPAIVDALFSLRFEHEWQRAEQLRMVIEHLGRDVNRRFLEATKKRDREAQALMARNSDEWWRRRSKIEPIVPWRSPTAREADELEEEDEDEALRTQRRPPTHPDVG